MMKLYGLLTFVYVSVLLTTPAQALPKTAENLHQKIVQKYDGDANHWADQKHGDFEKIGCRNRTDLLQQLFDDNLNVTTIDTYTLHVFYECALKREREEILEMIVEPTSLSRLEQESKWGLPLLDAVAADNYNNMLVLLNNGAGVWDNRKMAQKNYTRDGHILMMSRFAINENRLVALSAIEDAGFADIVSDAKNKDFVGLVVQIGWERDGGSGTLLGGIADLAIGAALGDSTTDLLLSVAGSTVLDNMTEKNDLSSVGNKIQLQSRMARYLKNVDVPYAQSVTGSETKGKETGGENTVGSKLEELERLAKLRQQGFLTETEFNELKSEIIANE